MRIDWLTVGFQILNFLVLAYLLKRFLYGPIIRSMAAREARIAERLREGGRMKEEAARESREHQAQRKALEEGRERFLEKARADAEKLRRSLEQELRAETQALRERWTAELRAEREEFLREVRRRTVEQFVALARRGLGDLANATLEGQMAEVFLERLRDLDAQTRGKIREAAASFGGRIRVVSAFDLPSPLRARLTKAIHEVAAAETDIAYETSAEVACGIALKTGGENVTWSLDGYLDALERDLSDALGRLAAKDEGEAVK